MLTASLITVLPGETSWPAFYQKHVSLKDSPPPYGGTLVWGTTNPPTIINPILTQSSVSSALLSLIFDSLIRVDGHGHIVGDLAESWEISKDGLEYTFHLKKDVKFHDGKEFTAADVKFTYEAISDARNKSHWRSNTEMIHSWKIIDDYTIKAVLQKPSVNLLYKFVRPIAPKHLLEGKDLANSSFNYHPVGTGAFRFKKWDRERNVIELEANQNYFQGRPYLDRIVIKSYSDISSLWAAFMRQEIDLLKYIRREDYLILKDDPAFKAYKIAWDVYYAIAYDLQNSVMKDPALRRAIAHGINIEEVIRKTSGEGVPSVGPFQLHTEGFNSDVGPLRYDAEKAKYLLQEAGWKDSDGDGIVEKNGHPLEIAMLVDSRKSTDKTLAMFLRQQLAEIGIKLHVRFYKDEKELSPDPFKRFKVQAWLRFFIGSGADSQSLEPALGWYSSSSYFANFGGYKNKEVDKLFTQARSEINADLRRKLYLEMYKIIYEDQPVTFLFYPMSYHALSADIANADDFFTMYMPTYTMKDWYVVNPQRR